MNSFIFCYYCNSILTIVTLPNCRPLSGSDGVYLDRTQFLFDQYCRLARTSMSRGLWLKIADIRRYFSAFIYFVVG